MPRPILILSLLSGLSTPPLAGCATPCRPVTVLAHRPPCHLASDAPPTTDAEPMSPAWVAYYREIVAWAWRVHVACGAEGQP